MYVNDQLQSSYKLKSGTRPANSPGGRYDGTYSNDYEFSQSYGNLGSCNNHFGNTKEYPGGTNYYVLTKNFPFIPRCWIGEADSSFKKNIRSGGRRNSTRQREHNRRPPVEAINACLNKSSNDNCSFTGRRGENIFGSCNQTPGGLGCIPKHRH